MCFNSRFPSVPQISCLGPRTCGGAVLTSCRDLCQGLIWSAVACPNYYSLNTKNDWTPSVKFWKRERGYALFRGSTSVDVEGEWAKAGQAAYWRGNLHLCLAPSCRMPMTQRSLTWLNCEEFWVGITALKLLRSLECLLKGDTNVTVQIKEMKNE